MKILKIISMFLLLGISFGGSLNSYAADNTLQITNISKTSITNREVTRAESFGFITKYLLSNIPESYKYISLQFTDVKEGTKLYENLQKLVYMDLIPNTSVKVNSSEKIKAYTFYKMVEGAVGIEFIDESSSDALKNRNTDLNDLLFVNDYLYRLNKASSQNRGGFNVNFTQDENMKFKILFDVYTTLNQEHYNSNNFDKEKIIYSAIEGIANGTDDKYTTFFPPSESKDFSNSLAGEFEGIGAYVEMQKAGELNIISPIPGSPAEKAGLKAGDKIIKIDGKEIDKGLDANAAVNLIKGTAGTKVKLTIVRENSTFEVEVTRDKVILHDVEYKVINNNVFYIQIRMFGDKVFDEFKKSLEELNKTPGITKVVIDLRNNPGGYLDQVTQMLSLFIEKGKPVAVVKSRDGSEDVYHSDGYNLTDLSKYDLYVLGNSGTASASEIMIGTMKDYFPKLTFVGEKTYGKGSVQTLRSYYDGSSLKYTIAKWYTGMSQTGIDGVGISPDVEVKLDENNKTDDKQLNYILTK